MEAGEILLPPDLAVALVDDLEKIGMAVDGVDFWRRHGADVVEIPWGQATTGSSVATRAEDARRTILDKWPDEADYASLVFEAYFYRE